MVNNNYSQSETEVTLGLLKAVHENQTLTQRSAAQELGIALGMVNTYLKRCVKTGLIKIKQAPSSRYAYYLTPKGFAEKSRLTASYLSQSMSFFRIVRSESGELLQSCDNRGWRRVALIGKSELCEITILGASEYQIELVGIIDKEAAKSTGTFMNIPVFASEVDMGEADVYLITDMKTPQETYDRLTGLFPPERVLAMPFLGIHKGHASNDQTDETES